MCLKKDKAHVLRSTSEKDGHCHALTKEGISIKLMNKNTPESFLELYKGSGYDEAAGKVIHTVEMYVVGTRVHRCTSCRYEVSKERKDDKKAYCDLRDKFIHGTRFVVKYRYPETTVCPICGKEIEKMSSNSWNTPEFFDINYKRCPAKITVSRQKAVCPTCGRSPGAVRLPGLQVDKNHKFSLRLVSALSEHYLKDGIAYLTQAQIAIGYGVGLDTIKNYTKRACEEFKSAADERYAVLIKRSISEWQDEIRSGKAKREISSIIYFRCMSSVFNLSLCFSKAEDHELELCTAFDEATFNGVSNLMKGTRSDFAISPVSNEERIRLAYFYSGTAYPKLNRLVSYYLVRILLDYSAMLEQDVPDITDEMRKAFSYCRMVLATEQYDLHELVQTLGVIAETCSCKLTSFDFTMDAMDAYCFFDELYRKTGVEAEEALSILTAIPVSDDDRSACKQISELIEDVLREDANHAPGENEAFDIGYRRLKCSRFGYRKKKSYWDNVQMTIQRLLYINPNAPKLAATDEFPITPILGDEEIEKMNSLPGIPIASLCNMLNHGLLSSEGKPYSGNCYVNLN